MHGKIVRCSVIVSVITIFISCQKKDIDTAKQINKQEAINIIDRYTQAFAEGDSTRILQFWSSRSIENLDFWNLHAYIGTRILFSFWSEFLTLYAPQVRDIRPFEDYAIIDLIWISRDATTAQTRQPREMRYYIVQENGRWVFINPIDILTQDWESYESDHFIYHFPREIHIAEHMHEIKASDKSFKDMLHFFNIELADKIHFYKPRTAEECGELILHPAANGYAVLPPKQWLKHPAAYKIISPSLYHPHEVAHCLTALAGVVCDNHIISEGFAVALGGVAGAIEDLTLIETRNNLEASKLLPLEKLFTMPTTDFFRINYITYYESGALIRFLHDLFGMDKLRQFCADIEDCGNLSKSLNDVYQISIDTFEDQFHEYLLSREIANIGFDISAEATPVFTMTDPENDDTGDGDYVYPRHSNFKKGVFDLRQFTVLKDKENAYFRVTMSKLMTPVTYGTSDEQFTPCIVIAIHKGKQKQMSQHHDCHGIRLPPNEGYHIKLNIGSAVSFSNYLGKVYFTTPDIVYEFVNKEENAIDLSVPLDMIGEPEVDWKYFVGVGLTSNRTMNFIDGGPMPVRQNHPVFISGGNYPHGNPDFIDILLPSSIEQEKVLSQYDMPKNIKPMVPMIEGSN